MRFTANALVDWNTGGSTSPFARYDPDAREAVPTWSDCAEPHKRRGYGIICQAQVWRSANQTYGEWARAGLEEAKGLVVFLEPNGGEAIGTESRCSANALDYRTLYV